MNTRTGLILLAFVLMFTQPTWAQAPRDNNYTALSAVHLQNAQGEEDPLKAEEAYQRGLRTSLEGIEAEPSNSQSYFHAGVAYLGLRQYVKADSMFSVAEEMHPDYSKDTDLFRENGWIQAYNDGLDVEDGDYDAAIEQFNNANLIYDLRPEAYLNLGSSYANKGEQEVSIEAYGQAVERIDLPESADRDEETLQRWKGFKIIAWINTGQILVSLDRAAEAVPYLRQVLEIDPDNRDAKTNLAVAMASSGQGGDATGIYEDIINSSSSSHIDLYNAGVGLYQAAARASTEADELEDSADSLEAAGDSAETARVRADASRADSVAATTFSRAVEAFETSLERSPMFRDALQNLVQALAQAARDDVTLWERMPEFSGKLLEMDPRNELAYQLHGIALARTGDSDQAVALDERRQALPFVIESLQLQPAGSGVRIVGAFVNRTLEQGASRTLRFTFYDLDGNTMGTVDTDVAAPAQEMAEVFRVEFSGDSPVGGYSYVVVGG